MQGGETLAGIAAQLWGDASLWYKLASANGLTADSAMTTGQVLAVPAGVVRSTYNADSYRPYDPADMLGDLSPVTPTPAAKRGNKCGAFGKILLVVVAVAVTIVSSGTALALSGAVGSVTQGITTVLSLSGAATVGTSTLIAAGVAGAMVGSAVSQGVGIATGMQDRFDWTGVAMAGLAAGVSGGLAAAGIGSGVAGAALRGALGNTITQGVAMATGLQKRFDWVGLAVAGVTATVGQAVAGDRPSFWRQTAAGAASGIAGAATRSVLTRTSFGDNILAVLPDVIGSTVGRLAARQIAGGGRVSTSAGKAATLSASSTESGSGAQDAPGNPVSTARNINAGTAIDELSIAREAAPIYGPAEPGVSYAVQTDDELIVTGDLSKRTIAIDYSLISWLAPSPSMLFPSGSITPYSNPLGQYFTQLPNAWQGFHYAGRDYRSAAEAQAFGMPVLVDALSPRREYEARRDAAFLASIGSGPLGLGPIAYVLGSGPERINASGSLDVALGGLMQGVALRPVGRTTQLSTSRPELEPLSRSSVGTDGISSASRTTTGVRADLPAGSFSISDWSGYPAGVPKPQGPFRIVEGTEYDLARAAANKANGAIRKEQGLVGQPVDVHDIQPVKFGGSPTDPANKVILPRGFHRQQVTPWWNRLQSQLGY
ncbi:hypothetical protein [Sphingomonas sp. CFBP 13720]|uniref:hypothetical protein n=1 Tax=Sphingomonas sp. CFBP 13720 TaxID=2775302 RepID=UPI0017844FF4|nr:hypothetical protein [Sphingomonas sp. CFBP 13720]